MRGIVAASCWRAGEAILLGVVLALSGCATMGPGAEPAPAPAAEVVAPAPVPPAPPAPPPQAPEPAPPAQAAPPAPPLPSMEDVFFAFDRADLGAEAKAALGRSVTALKANPAVTVVIEGHCDERGTNQYNLALGERRAMAVRNSLVAAGIAASRITTISYGEERPFVLGHDESAWRYNRRGHLVPKSP